MENFFATAVRAKIAAGRTFATPEDCLIADLCEDVTDEFILEAPRDVTARSDVQASAPTTPPRRVRQANFAAVVNNYPWTRTDKGYLRQLLKCKTQADDVLHRQISRKPCVLRSIDLPASVCLKGVSQRVR